MTDMINILAIINGAMAFLVGFLLIFLQYHPQRKRLLIQQLQLKLLDADEDTRITLKKAIEDAEKEDTITFNISIKTINLFVFFYAVVIFSISMLSIILYILKNNIPNIFIYTLIIFTIIGYWLLIPIVKYSYLEPRYLKVENILKEE